MPKIILIMTLLLMGQGAWAQLSEEELQRELDRMEEEMTIALQRLQETVENGQLFQLDTTVYRIFPYDGPREPGVNPQQGPLELQQLLDQFTGQLTEEDWAELHRLFDDFQQSIPDPEGLDTPPGEGGESPSRPSKSKKKRKVYSL